jgi:Replication protein
MGPLDNSRVPPAVRRPYARGDGHGQPHTSLDTSASSVKRRLVALLHAAGDRIRAAAVARCGAEFHALRCANGHLHQAVPTERCRYRLCPDCARWRRRRAFARAWPAMQACRRRHPRDRWVLITLTVRVSHDPLPQIVRRVKYALARLRRSHDWQRCIRGGIVSFEMTYHAERGWHMHAHLLASRRAWWPQAELAAHWQRVTGGEGQVVDIRPVTGMRDGLAAVLRYVFKPANLLTWGPEQVRQFTALHRVKLSECYGELRGLAATWEADEVGRDGEPAATPLMEGDPCPRCGAVLVAQRVLRSVVVAAWNPS